ncbi:MAG: sirohydrochlorin cobaltochelatase [Kiritimatiellae bacterium]|nr:sirohydrochlorin cobaltochelatase [Kiritimatiellia bacterium]
MKLGLLIATAGTSCAEAAQVFCGFDRSIAERFDGLPRYWAYTSSGVRRKLAAKGEGVDDPVQALARMREDGVTHAAVLSLHMAPGMEYSELKDAVIGASDRDREFERTTISAPLLSCSDDVDKMVSALLDSIPADVAQGDGVLFVAHGSRRAEAQEHYRAADAACRRLDRPVFLGTMIPQANRGEMLWACHEAGVRRVFLVPFMIAAGFSAREEIAGTGVETWQTAVEAAGMTCCPVLRGVGECEGVVDVWLDRVQALLNDLERA